MTFQVSFTDPWTYKAANTAERLPLSSLPKDGKAHIHGRLEICVAGRSLPCLGYFGPSDVCMNEWVYELVSAATALSSEDPSEYIYDEGEQGQPAFKFARVGPSVFVSVVASTLSDAEGDPNWQGVECSLSEFVKAITDFRESFVKMVTASAPVAGAKWCEWAMKRKA